MPDLLAIDTTSELCQVALLKNGVYSSLHSAGRRQHAQKLLPMVAELLQSADVTLNELDTIAVVVGPGSFTGLRIGIGVAQGLAHAAAIPLVPISSLATLAMTAMMQVNTASVLVCTEAREGEVYFAAYKPSPSLGVQLSGSEQVTAVDKLKPDFQPIEAEQWLAVGDGWSYVDQLRPVLGGVNFNLEMNIVSSTEAVCQLAGLAFSQGRALTPEQVQPNYIKDQMNYSQSGSS